MFDPKAKEVEKRKKNPGVRVVLVTQSDSKKIPFVLLRVI